MLEIKGSKIKHHSSEKLFNTWKQVKESNGYSFSMVLHLNFLQHGYFIVLQVQGLICFLSSTFKHSNNVCLMG